MENTVINRIRIIYKEECGTLDNFSELLNVPLGTLKNIVSRGGNPNFDTLYKIASTFPKYSMDWLITGKGEMLKTGGDSISLKGNANIVNRGNIGGGVKTYQVSGRNNNVSEVSTGYGDKDAIIEKLQSEITRLEELLKSKDAIIQNLEIEVKHLNELLKAKEEIIELLRSK